MNYISLVATTFFQGVWDLLVSTDFPGVGISFASVLIGFFLIRFSIKIFGYIAGFHGASGSDYGKAADQAEKLKSRKNH